MKTKIRIILITLTLLGFGLLPIAQAVVPAPDGGYPGGNTAEGQSALLSLTSGGFNTAVGFFSLRSNATGQLNTAIGAGTLFANTADQNTATGTGALFSNSTGGSNTANGAFALFFNTAGFQNTAVGAQTLGNTSGSNNTATGFESLDFNTIGNQNTANGYRALQNNTTGSVNTALGASAGFALTTGDNNIDIGYNVVGVAGESNTIRIGNTDMTDTYIRGISGATASGGTAVFVNGNGKLGTMTSSARFKDQIKPMAKASEALFALKPVIFHYKKAIDPQGIPQFGLVAEDVEAVNPDLVVRDGEGKVSTVRYEAINAMLLNEFLKEHKAFVDEQTKVQKLEAVLETVNERLKEQEAKIESVSAQIEMSNPAPQMAANER